MMKIPPPILVLILVVSSFLSSKKIDVIHIPNQTLISILIFLIGILILIIPVSKFIKSKTTIDPIKFKKVNKPQVFYMFFQNHHKPTGSFFSIMKLL